MVGCHGEIEMLQLISLCLTKSRFLTLQFGEISQLGPMLFLFFTPSPPSVLPPSLPPSLARRSDVSQVDAGLERALTGML